MKRKKSMNLHRKLKDACPKTWLIICKCRNATCMASNKLKIKYIEDKHWVETGACYVNL